MKILISMTVTALLAAFTLADFAQTRAQSEKGVPTQNPESPNLSKPKEFVFSGGNLDAFVGQIKQQLGIDLWEHGTIPNEMRFVPVPKMRMESPTLFSLLNLYNQIASEGNAALGHWTMLGIKDNDKPDVIVLVSPRQKGTQAGAKLVTRAFPLRGIEGQSQDMLMDTIREEAERLRAELEQGAFGNINANQAIGHIRYHANSNILVASGDDTYVSLVESLVEAFRERAGAPKNTRTSDAQESRGKVYIVGPVRQPGSQDIAKSEILTVSKAIMRAGGFNDFADRKDVKITRRGGPGEGDKKTYKVDVGEILDKGRVEKDLPLENGDIIVVPERAARF